MGYDQLSTDAPQQLEEPINYWDFLDHELPLRDGDSDYNKQTITRWNELLLRFTKPGNPGSKFKNPAEKLNKSAILSKNVKQELGIDEKEEDEATLL